MAAPLVSRFVCAKCDFTKIICYKSNLPVGHGGISAAVAIPVRNLTNKHYDPKWRRERGRKFNMTRIKLPDWQKLKRESTMPPDEMRAYQKREKQQPPRTDQERNIVIASTSNIFEPYVPPEGDGRASAISGKGAKQSFEQLGKKSKSLMDLRKIKQFEDDFDSKEFALEAQEKYIEANTLLQDIKKNKDRLHELVTEKAYPEMTWELRLKTFRWKFIESVEPPRVVHVRKTDLISKENVYGQITVRFHTKQALAIYDRFGRLMYGSENLQRDCLEYVVFEKHLSDSYSSWRIHGKVVPDWMARRPAVYRTMRQPIIDEDLIQEEEEEEEEGQGKEGGKAELATA